MARLSNKVALVFGGGSAGGEINNGLATSIVYAQAGATVVIVDINDEAVQSGIARLTRECETAGVPFEGTGMVGDVTAEESVSSVVDHVISRYGRIDILHNNVGVARMGGPIEMSLEEWEVVMRINLTSAFLTCKFVLPHMITQGSGSIVNVASIGGMRYIGYNYPSYSATKGGMIQFTTNIALQYARNGIRANCVAPGYIESPLMYRQISGNYDSVDTMVATRNALSPTGKMGDCFDVAYASLFLASDEAKYVNGVCLPVDGGLTQQAAPSV